jgi:pilus assembly protein Flp/PilA
MARISAKLSKFTSDEFGTTAIEYGLIATLVGVAILGTVTGYGNSVVAGYNSVTAAFNATSSAN